MMKIPNIECFENTQAIAKDHQSLYMEVMTPIFIDFVSNFSNYDIEEFIDLYEQKRTKIVSEITKKYSGEKFVLDWFERQPAFQGAFGRWKIQTYSNRTNTLIESLCYRIKYIFFEKTAQLPLPLQKIEDQLRHVEFSEMTKEEKQLQSELFDKKHAYLYELCNKEKESLEVLIKYKNKFTELNLDFKGAFELNLRHRGFLVESGMRRLGIYFVSDTGYFSFISELSRMSLWYITGTYLERITSSKDRINKIIELLDALNNEVDLLMESKWYPEKIESLVLPMRDFRGRKGNSVSLLKKIAEKEELSIGIRKDQTVQERLMIIDLISLHKKITSYRINKREIFKIMELPFINNLIEMKTIERIIKSEKDNDIKVKDNA